LRPCICRRKRTKNHIEQFLWVPNRKFPFETRQREQPILQQGLVRQAAGFFVRPGGAKTGNIMNFKVNEARNPSEAGEFFACLGDQRHRLQSISF
jgi:hypothetical protein